MISPVVQCLFPLLLVAGVVHPYYIEHKKPEYKEPSYNKEPEYKEPAYTKKPEYKEPSYTKKPEYEEPSYTSHEMTEHPVITEDAHAESAETVTVAHADNSNEEVHTDAPTEHVLVVDPNFNLDEQLSAYQKTEGLELSQLGFFN